MAAKRWRAEGLPPSGAWCTQILISSVSRSGGGGAPEAEGFTLWSVAELRKCEPSFQEIAGLLNLIGKWGPITASTVPFA